MAFTASTGSAEERGCLVFIKCVAPLWISANQNQRVCFLRNQHTKYHVAQSTCALRTCAFACSALVLLSVRHVITVFTTCTWRWRRGQVLNGMRSMRKECARPSIVYQPFNSWAACAVLFWYEYMALILAKGCELFIYWNCYKFWHIAFNASWRI